MNRLVAEQGLWVLGVAGLLAIAAYFPEPLGYGAAMTALMTGPGHGLPVAIFGSDYLSTPERLLLTVLTSIVLAVGALYVAAVLGPPLTGTSAGLIVLALTSGASVINVVRGAIGAQRPAGQPSDGHWRQLVFAMGVALGLLTGVVAWHFAGLS